MRSKAAMPTARSVAPSQSAIELAVDLVAVLDSWIPHLARLSALEFDVMIGTKSFDHRIKALTRPWQQLTKPMDRDPIVAFAEAVIGVLKLSTLGLRLEEPSALLLVIEPGAQGFSQSSVT